MLGDSYSAKAPSPDRAASRREWTAALPRTFDGAARRIYYVSPLLVGPAPNWRAMFERARGLGFNTVLIAPPFDPGRAGHLHAAADFDRVHPVLAANGPTDSDDYLAALVREASELGLALFCDLVLDRLAADSSLLPESIAARAATGEPDPRKPLAPSGSVQLDFGSEPTRRFAFKLFPQLVARLAGLGIAGFRCLAPQNLPVALWQAITAATRNAIFLAWTPGLAPEVVDRLVTAGFHRSFASTPWWDLRTAWLAEEYEARRLSLPAIGLVEEPGGPRLAGLEAADPTARKVAARCRLWSSAIAGFGYLLPMGFEFGARRPLDLAGDRPADWDWLLQHAEFDLSDDIAAANALMAREPALSAAGQLRFLAGNGATVTALARLAGGHLPGATQAVLAVINPGHVPATVAAEALLPGLAGGFAPFRALGPDRGAPLVPGAVLALAPQQVALFTADRLAEARRAPRLASARDAVAAPRVVIERIAPGLGDGGQVLKRLSGETLTVEADIFCDGHEVLRAVLLWRHVADRAWQQSEMRPLDNDRWQGTVPLGRVGRYSVAVEAWRDLFGTWRDEVEKKHGAGLALTLELREGCELLRAAAEQAEADDASALRALSDRVAAADPATALSLMMAEETRELMARAAEHTQATRAEPLTVMADRRAAGFASWYEMFPRSWAAEAGRHGTFDDVIAELPAVRRMGFDVLYFPPIHPIGRANRKGRNNTLTPAPDDPGSPYAIGGRDGGHDAIHPELGDLESFRRLLRAAEQHGMEIALDFAIQCSPDHPWLKAHPGWFAWRPDGSLRYAENPPKKYEDIVNVEFYAKAAVPELWHALRDVVLFWAGEGVRTFRVDNPHTKPLPFWAWLIDGVQQRHPDAVFLSEAFTRPKMMQRLAKIGFSQSYTYFTWRNTKQELTEYLTELTQTEMRDYFRPHFFVNTPDINPYFLQTSGRPGFLIRAALATTLSGLWGMYSGFEVCEGRAISGREEYVDAEKYQFRRWDREAPGNIVAEITRLNRIRRENPALHSHLGLAFLNCGNDRMLCYRKSTPARDNTVLVVVSLDPHAPQEASFEVPLWEFGMPDSGSVEIEDLMHETHGRWTGKLQHIRLDPAHLPFAIWRIAPASS